MCHLMKKGVFSMLYFYLLVIPALGVLWFLNFTTFLMNLSNGKNTRNQIMIGGSLTFVLLFAIMLVVVSFF
jgi:hypothetical protein